MMNLEDLIEQANSCFGAEPVIELEMSRKLAPDGKTPYRHLSLVAYSLDDNLREIRFDASFHGSESFASLFTKCIEKISATIKEGLSNKFARYNAHEREYLEQTLALLLC